MNQTVFFIFIIISLLTVITVKRYDSAFGIVLSLFAAAVIISQSIYFFENIIGKLNELTFYSGLFSIPLKAFGITLISKIVISLCEDSGEKLLGFAALFVTKIAIVFITLPIIEDVLELLNEIAQR